MGCSSFDGLKGIILREGHATAPDILIGPQVDDVVKEVDRGYAYAGWKYFRMHAVGDLP